MFGHFFQNGCPGQTTMLGSFVSKFCLEPRPESPNISHLESKSTWKTPNIVSWPECQLELPGDGGGGDGVPTSLPIWQEP